MLSNCKCMLMIKFKVQGALAQLELGWLPLAVMRLQTVCVPDRDRELLLVAGSNSSVWPLLRDLGIRQQARVRFRMSMDGHPEDDLYL